MMIRKPIGFYLSFLIEKIMKKIQVKLRKKFLKMKETELLQLVLVPIKENQFL